MKNIIVRWWQWRAPRWLCLLWGVLALWLALRSYASGEYLQAALWAANVILWFPLSVLP